MQQSTSTQQSDTSARIFVFGSNLAGRQGKGAALHARKHYGAINGKVVGRQGQSYAIPTKDANLQTLPLITLASYIGNFIAYAVNNPDLRFEVTRVGCGLAGYTDQQIAPLFRNAPANCKMPDGWRKRFFDEDNQEEL